MVTVPQVTRGKPLYLEGACQTGLSGGAKSRKGGFCKRSPGGSRFPSFQLKELIASTRLGTYYNSSSVYSFG